MHHFSLTLGISKFRREVLKIGIEKCRDPGSNQGPLDLQSNALPTELSRLQCGKPPTNEDCLTYCNWLLAIKVSVRNVAKSYRSSCIEGAMKHWTLTSIVQLLINSRTFGCWVSPLALFALP